MDVVDTQVHANLLGTDVTLAIMDALGITGLLFDEYVGVDHNGALHPGYRLPNGTFRSIGPHAEAAALRHPDRFAFLMRVDPLDPGIDCWVETLSAAPGFKAMRTLVVTAAQKTAFIDGGYQRLLKVAQIHGVPVFVGCPDLLPRLADYARRFPDVQFVIDHCGAATDKPPGEATIDDALTLARFDNVALKWAHAAPLLSQAPYPFSDLNVTLRRAVDAFGPHRVMWASDYTATRERANWGESLFCIRHSPSLSEDDKEWILGRTARSLLNWTPPDSPREPAPP